MPELHVQVDNYDDYEGWLNAHVVALVKDSYHVARGYIDSKVSVEDIEKAIEKLELALLASSAGFFSGYNEHVFICQPSSYRRDDPPTVVFDKSSSGMNISTYHMDRKAAIELYNRVRDQFEVKNVGPEQVNFGFWQVDDDGCDVQYNRLKCPEIDSIRGNYTSKVFDEAIRIAELEKPYQHGKIMLWHGPPGNGKTFLIRAFARLMAVRHNITPEVIIDPENLFSTPKYLTSLLLRRGPAPGRKPGKQAFRLFIAEDCAQLFATDCRNHEGFSRLLNTADGLIGQGQKLIFLFTANEKIDEIDSAILRPGRCLQNLAIGDWDKRRASNWLTERDRQDLIPKLGSRISLAELYALMNDVTTPTSHKDTKIGF